MSQRHFNYDMRVWQKDPREAKVDFRLVNRVEGEYKRHVCVYMCACALAYVCLRARARACVCRGGEWRSSLHLISTAGGGFPSSHYVSVICSISRYLLWSNFYVTTTEFIFYCWRTTYWYQQMCVERKSLLESKHGVTRICDNSCVTTWQPRPRYVTNRNTAVSITSNSARLRNNESRIRQCVMRGSWKLGFTLNNY
jgi:hypothetical protein